MDAEEDSQLFFADLHIPGPSSTAGQFSRMVSLETVKPDEGTLAIERFDVLTMKENHRVLVKRYA